MPWQRDLETELLGPADERKIIFYVDPRGNSGKTWFQQWFLSRQRDIAQIVGIGKRDDMAYAIDETKRVFLVSVPRGEMVHLQYSVLESIKDRLLFSPKYEARMKYFSFWSHVVVFSNEEPDHSRLSLDRFDIRRLGQPDIILN